MIKIKDRLSSVYYMLMHQKISIRLLITVLFILLLTGISLSIILVNRFTLNKVLISSATSLIYRTDMHIQSETHNYLRPLYDDTHKAARLISEDIVKPENNRKFIRYLLEMVVDNPIIFAAVWISPENDIYAILRPSSNEFYFGFSKHANNHINFYKTRLDAKGTSYETTPFLNTEFIPTERPWYIDAVQKKSLVWTGIFQYENILKISNMPSFGMSAAEAVYDEKRQLRGVFSISISADELKKFIENIRITPHSIIIITDQYNNLVAMSSKLNTEPYIAKKITPEIWKILDVPRPSEGFSALDNQSETILKLRYKNKDYFLSRKALFVQGGQTWHQTIIVPLDDILNPLKRTLFASLIFVLFIFIIGVFWVRYISQKISRPMSVLVNEVKAIQELKLDKPLNLETRIQEIYTITSAIESMKSGLKSFQRYVPISLVKKLIQSGKIARVGGESKKITLLFCDIENFTTISEKLSAENLIYCLSEFLEQMTKIILSKQGTVDKYIGDAIMAFWGAPLPDQYQALHACECALLMFQALKKLNLKLNQEGFASFAMRVGINTGDAIVGNVGSSERLNFTAIGDSVNLANRLESINKLYHTRIIISETTYELIKSHIPSRLLDYVAVKGKLEGTYIYELLDDSSSIHFDELDQYNVDFKNAFNHYKKGQWDEALLLFETLKIAYPNDPLASIFIERLLYLKVNVPGSWNGIWKLE